MLIMLEMESHNDVCLAWEGVGGSLSLVVERQRRGEVIGEVSLGLMTSGLFVVTGCYMVMAAAAVVVQSVVVVPVLFLSVVF